MRFDKEYSDYMHGKCKNYNQGLYEALEEMERENEDIVTHSDNKCSNCGGTRVEGSPLCVDCLQVQLKEELREKRELNRIIYEQALKIGKLRVLCEKLLDHIVNDRISASALATSMFENWRKKELADDGRLEMLLKCRQGLAKMVEKEAGDEKNGVSGNT